MVRRAVLSVNRLHSPRMSNGTSLFPPQRQPEEFGGWETGDVVRLVGSTIPPGSRGIRKQPGVNCVAAVPWHRFENASMPSRQLLDLLSFACNISCILHVRMIASPPCPGERS